MNEKPDPISGSGAGLPNSVVKSRVTLCRLVLAATVALALVVVCYFTLKALNTATLRLMARAPVATAEQQKMCGAIWKKTNITPSGNVATAPKFPPFRPPFDPGIVIVFSAALLDDERCAAEKIRQMAAHASPTLLVIYDEKNQKTLLSIRNYDGL